MLHFHLADQYRRGASPIHRLDPRVKLLGTLAFVLATALLPAGHWLEYGLLLGALTSIALATGLGATYALRRSFVALPFALAAITLPFTVPGHVIGYLGPWAVSAEGLIRFGSRVDVYLDEDMVPLVAVGQRTVAGETVIADATGSDTAPRRGEVR